MINKEDAHVNNELFKKHFKVEKPTLNYEVLRKTNDKEKNIELVNVINSGLKDLKEEIKKMSKEEIEIEKPDEIVRVDHCLQNFCAIDLFLFSLLLLILFTLLLLLLILFTL